MMPRSELCPRMRQERIIYADKNSIRKGWFSNASFTTGLKTLPTFRPDALVFFRAKKNSMLFTETSAKNGTNVEEAFHSSVRGNCTLCMSPVHSCIRGHLYSMCHVSVNDFRNDTEFIHKGVTQETSSLQIHGIAETWHYSLMIMLQTLVYLQPNHLV